MLKNEVKKPEVKLINWSPNPLYLIWTIWHQSKYQNQDECPSYSKDGAIELMERLIEMDVPILENVQMIFKINNISVSWREQAVRHRIMVDIDDKIGVDIIPDVTESTWWSQSMRILNMGKFADNMNFRVPDSILSNNDAYLEYCDLMCKIQEFYKKSVAIGIPMEDAREALPLASLHNISWKLNYKIMMHIVGKRSCWILQAGLWMPIISGMIKEIRGNMGNVFGLLGRPPCMKSGTYESCKFVEENTRRINKMDNLPVCPLYYFQYNDLGDHLPGYHLNTLASEIHKNLSIDYVDIKSFIEDFKRRCELYIPMWYGGK